MTVLGSLQVRRRRTAQNPQPGARQLVAHDEPDQDQQPDEGDGDDQPGQPRVGRVLGRGCSVRRDLIPRPYIRSVGNYSGGPPRSEKTITKTRHDESTKPNMQVAARATAFEVDVFILPFLPSWIPAFSCFRSFVFS